MKTSIHIVSLLVLLVSSLSAATIETREVCSAVMKTNVTCAVVRSEGYDAAKRYPVVCGACLSSGVLA